MAAANERTFATLLDSFMSGKAGCDRSGKSRTMCSPASTQLLVLASICCSLAHCSISRTKPHEERLIEYLFKHNSIDPLQRPPSNGTGPVVVNATLSLIQIVQIDEKSQFMRSNVWNNFEWFDDRFKWSPSEFGGIQTVRVKPDSVWTPDIVFFNNADGAYGFTWRPNVLISASGTMLWIPPAIYKSTCSINVEYFPFDQQICHIQHGSWTYNTAELLIRPSVESKIDMNSYKESGSWDLLDWPVSFYYKSNPSIQDSILLSELNHTGIVRAPQKHPRLKKQMLMVSSVVLQRKPLFYTVNMIVPCVMIAFLSVCVFYLPSDAGEKVTLSISVLLAQVVFMLLVSKILPPSSAKIPLISKFLLFTFAMNYIAIIMTVIMINWNHRSARTHNKPGWLRNFLLGKVARLLFCTKNEIVEEIQLSPEQQKFNEALEQVSDLSSDEDMQSELTVRNNNSMVFANQFAKMNLDQTTSFSDSSNSMLERGAPEHTIFSSDTDRHWSDTCTNTRPKLTRQDTVSQSTSDSNCIFRSSSNILCNHMNTADTIDPLYGDPLAEEETSLRKMRKFGDRKQKRLPVHLRSAMKSVAFITNHINDQEKEEATNESWKMMATVMDRIQLIIFLLATVFGTIYILIPSNQQLQNFQIL